MEVFFMSRKNRSLEEQARRAKIWELLQASSISSMDDIQNLFKAYCNGIVEDYFKKSSRKILIYKTIILQIVSNLCADMKCPKTVAPNDNPS